MRGHFDCRTGLYQLRAPRTAPTRRRNSTRMWRMHARQVRRLHEKLFYRPLLDAVARLPTTPPG